MEQIQSLLESVLVLMPGANITQLSAIIHGIYVISSGDGFENSLFLIKDAIPRLYSGVASFYND